jgi:4-amino-4-deoxy-L-arabinose transferase-like glycosyltransferase
MKAHSSVFRSLVAVAVLSITVIALYFNSLHYPFALDDFAFFSSPEKLGIYQSASIAPNIRELPYKTLALQTTWTGLSIFWLRLGNVLLHTANAIALFFFLRQLFRSTLSEPDKHPLSWISLGGALIFAAHPIAVYGVAYVIQRTILMATFFTLLMLILFLQGLQSGKWYWMPAAALCYAAAVYSKEHSIAAPAIALALTFLIRKPSVALLKQTLPYYLLCLPAAVSILLAAKAVVGATYEPHSREILNQLVQQQGSSAFSNPLLLSLITQTFLFFKYESLWLLPNPDWMSIDMREPFATSILGWPHTLGLGLFLAYPCLALWLLLKRGRTGLLGFALLFPWLLFLTELTTVRAQEPFVLYRSYLWTAGLLAALPFFLERWSSKQLLILFIVLAVLLPPLTLNRLHTFSSALALWDDAEKLVQNKSNLPGVEKIYTNRGNKLFQIRHFDEAIADLTKSIAVYPGDELVYGTRGKAYYHTQRYQEALADFNQAISLKPDSKRLYYDRSLTYRALGNVAAAQTDLEQSCKLGGVCP